MNQYPYDQWLVDMGLYDTLQLFPEFNKSYKCSFNDNVIIIIRINYER